MSKEKRRKLNSNSKRTGQALVEYVLLLSVAASLAMAFNSFFTGTLNKGIQKFNAVLESELRSGEYSSVVGLWEN